MPFMNDIKETVMPPRVISTLICALRRTISYLTWLKAYPSVSPNTVNQGISVAPRSNNHSHWTRSCSMLRPSQSTRQCTISVWRPCRQTCHHLLDSLCTQNCRLLPIMHWAYTAILCNAFSWEFERVHGSKESSIIGMETNRKIHPGDRIGPCTAGQPSKYIFPIHVMRHRPVAKKASLPPFRDTEIIICNKSVILGYPRVPSLLSPRLVWLCLFLATTSSWSGGPKQTRYQE